ncbi:hypothetical protein GCM10009566_39130 [Streptomyces murinus]
MRAAAVLRDCCGAAGTVRGSGLLSTVIGGASPCVTGRSTRTGAPTAKGRNGEGEDLGDPPTQKTVMAGQAVSPEC